MSDINIFEINEAFASQATYCVEKLGIDWNKVNPKGGAIALGHPLGCSGARILSTLVNELERRKLKRGLITMCVGFGQGIATIVELVQGTVAELQFLRFQGKAFHFTYTLKSFFIPYLTTT